MTAAYAHTWRVRVRGQRAIGAGTLVADRAVLTCAYVAARALGVDPRGGPPAGQTTVEFPGSARGDAAPASVDPAGWRPVGSPGGDLALLRLTADPPPDVRPAALRPCGEPGGREVQAFGHPAGLDAGVWARARLVGYGGPEPGWVRLEGVATGRPITSEFRGAGVIDAAGHVIGVVVAEDRQAATRAAWMIPVEAFLDRVPGLAGATGATGAAGATGPAARAVTGPAAHAVTGSAAHAVTGSAAGRGTGSAAWPGAGAAARRDNRPRDPRARAEAVSVAQLQQLAQALAEVPVMRDAESRRHVVDALRPAIAGNVPHHSARTIHVFGMLRTCLDYPGGLTELMSVVRGFAADSASLARVEDLIAGMGLDGV